VNKTISSGVIAFIQKPFTLDEIKKAVDIAESEYSLLQ
jgi:AmiR/NasT family two-component response regulator